MKSLWSLSLVALCVGCGGSAYSPVPVSGKVSVDGGAKEDLIVTFTPTDANDRGEVGPPSSGRTDSEGRFTLTQRGGEPGAAPGNYQVTIYTAEEAKPRPKAAADVLAPDAEPLSEQEAAAVSDNVYANSLPDPIPAIYNSASTLTFTVPADGTDQASFDITTGQ